ncbi:MAG: histidine kinase, partial [Alistipes sp.]|nr:histidine kinase [Alistipes sp.]
MSVKTNNPILGERLLYILVWAMALLVPILNSKMMSEEHVSLSNILLVWSKLLPYIIIFMINNGLLAPRLLFKRRYIEYFTIALVVLVAIFYPLQYYQDELRMIEYPDGSNYFVHGRASFTDLAWYWNVLLGLLMMGANCSIKFIFRSMQDEQKIAQMERQALQAEMDYLKYQINPHFFMNTLNNIHAMIDIDAEAAKECVIELSKMMRYVLYDSEQVHTNLWQEV